MGAGVTACSFSSWTRVENLSQTPVSDTSASKALIAFLQPYHDSLTDEMSQVVGYCPSNIEKARPCSSLNNLFADAVEWYFVRQFRFQNYFILLNVGGIRSTLNEGPITLGEIFMLMPFDNTLSFVKLGRRDGLDIQEYLKLKGGEVLGNARVVNGVLMADWNESDSIWVVTSDYLANGGDQMTFFRSDQPRIDTREKIRDILIKYISNSDTLKLSDDCRISF